MKQNKHSFKYFDNDNFIQALIALSKNKTHKDWVFLLIIEQRQYFDVFKTLFLRTR